MKSFSGCRWQTEGRLLEMMVNFTPLKRWSLKLIQIKTFVTRQRRRHFSPPQICIFSQPSWRLSRGGIWKREPLKKSSLIHEPLQHGMCLINCSLCLGRALTRGERGNSDPIIAHRRESVTAERKLERKKKRRFQQECEGWWGRNFVVEVCSIKNTVTIVLWKENLTFLIQNTKNHNKCQNWCTNSTSNLSVTSFTFSK